MRLNEPNNRANTNIVNTLLGEESRYGGSKSSLDYKEQNNGVLTTAKTGKKKTDQKNQSIQEEKQPQQPEQEEPERKNERKSSFPTRARERTGIPPRRYDLSDLAKMDEYDLMNALREDPEFAAAVQEYSAQLEEKEKAEKAAEEERKDRRSKPSSAPVAERRKARLAKSAPSSPSSSEPVATPTIRPGSEIYPNHVRDLMDSGVPVTQWIVLLLLVGAGLYFLMGPELKEGLGYIMKQTGKTKKPSRKGSNMKSKLRSRQNNKGKKKMDAPRKASTVKKTPAIPKSKAEPVKKREAPKPERQQEGVEDTLAQRSVVEKTKKKKNKNKKKKETKTQAKESLNVASTDDGSTDHSEHEETPPLSSPPGVSTPLIFMESDDTDAGEWETVTKSRKPVAKAPPATPIAEEAPMATKKKAKKTDIVAPQLPVDKAKTTTPIVDIQQEVEAAQAASAEQEIESPQAANAEPESTDDSWATVTKTRKPKVATPAATKSAAAPDTESKPTESKPTESKTAEQVATTEDKKKQEAKALDDKTVKTKTSKNKKQTPSQPAKSENGSATDGDAALALKLQLEEENRANHETSGHAEEQWEEVKKNKTKKGQKATTS